MGIFRNLWRTKTDWDPCVTSPDGASHVYTGIKYRWRFWSELKPKAVEKEGRGPCS